MDSDMPLSGSSLAQQGANGNLARSSGMGQGGGGTPQHFQPSGSGTTPHGRRSPDRYTGPHASRTPNVHRYHLNPTHSGGSRTSTGTPSSHLTGPRTSTGSSLSPTRPAQKSQLPSQLSAYAQAHTVRDGLIWDDHREDAKKMQSSFQLAIGPSAPRPAPPPPRPPPPQMEHTASPGPASVLRPPRTSPRPGLVPSYMNGTSGPPYGGVRAESAMGGARPGPGHVSYDARQMNPQSSTPNYVPRNGNPRETPMPAHSMDQANAARSLTHRTNAHTSQPREMPAAAKQTRSTTPTSPPPPGATAKTILRSAPNAKLTVEERRQMDAYAQRRQMQQSRYPAGASESAPGDHRRLSSSDHYNPNQPELQEQPRRAGAPRGVKGPRSHPQKPRTDKKDKTSEADDAASGTKERVSHAGSASPRATYESLPYDQRASRGSVHRDEYRDSRDGQRVYQDDPVSKRARQIHETNGHRPVDDRYPPNQPNYYGNPQPDRRGSAHERALQTTIMGHSVHGMAHNRAHSYAPIPPPIHVPPPPQPPAHVLPHEQHSGPGREGQRSNMPVEGDEMVREADAGMQAYASKGSIQASGRGSVSGRSAAAGGSKIAGSKAGLASGTGKEAALKEPAAAAVGVSASGKTVKMSTGVSEKVAAAPAGKRAREKKQEDIEDLMRKPNQDFCSSCRGIGKFLCCDGCPRSFHFMCLDPPLKVDELPAEETWYCKKCRAERAEEVQLKSSSTTGSEAMRKAAKLAARPLPQTFKLLCRQMDEENPTAFRLPPEITNFFAGVGEDARGNYVDQEEPRSKTDRRNWQEDREGLRLTDRRSRPISCYFCGGTSFPNRGVSTDVGAVWRPIASCDYCALHWHLDCLTPPLATMPPAGRKWMCPNHVEQVMPRKRTIRGEVQVREVAKEGMRNNGNVEVVEDSEDEEDEEDGDSEDEGDKEAEYDGAVGDMVINRQKYKVPEKIIQMDFVNKVRERSGTARAASVTASASASANVSTGLSVERKIGSDIQLSEVTLEDLDAASLILGIFGINRSLPAAEPAKPQSSEALPKEAEPNTTLDMGLESDLDLDMEMDMDMDADIENATFSRIIDPSKRTEPSASAGGSTEVPVPPVACEAKPEVSANSTADQDSSIRASTPAPVNPVERWVPRPISGASNSRPASPAVSAMPTIPMTPSVPVAVSGTLAKMQTDSYAPISSYRSPKPATTASGTANGISTTNVGKGGDVDTA